MPLATLAPVLPYLGVAAASLAGTGLAIAGDAESQNAENKARANVNAEEQALQNKESQVAATNRQASSPANVNKELSQGAGTRENAWEGLNQLTAPVASALPATGGSSPTANAEKVSGSTANTWNNLISGDAAKMGSYSDLATKQGIEDQNTAEQLGMYNNFSQGDAGLLPLEMEVASQRGNQLSGWGTILSSLGNLAGLANAAGKFGTNTPQVAGTAAPAPRSDILSQMGFESGGYGNTDSLPGSTTLSASNVPNFWTKIYS